MKDWLKNIKVEHALAFMSIILTYAFLFYVVIKYYEVKELIFTIVGVVAGNLQTVHSYFFGSNKSSQKKDETVDKLIDHNKTMADEKTSNTG